MIYYLNDTIVLKDFNDDLCLVSPIYKLLKRLSLGYKKGKIIHIDTTSTCKRCYQVKFDTLIIEMYEEINYFKKIK